MLIHKCLQPITESRTTTFSSLSRVLRSDPAAPGPVLGRPHADSHKCPPLFVSILLLMALPMLAACSGSDTGSTTERASRAEVRSIFDDEFPTSRGTPPQNQEDTAGFAILLTGIPPRLRTQPDLALQQVTDAVGDKNVWLHEPDDDRPPLIFYGRYTDPTSSRAQADLRRIRAMQVDGRSPFAGAVIMPVGEHTRPDDRQAQYDLRRVKKTFGKEAVYTLQIGVYAREDARRPSQEDLAAFRRAAEQAVERLRREGDQAFFYHGPNGSMVTVGVFNDGDMDTSVTPPIESRRLADLRSRHPHNLLNGRGVREMVPTGSGRAEPRIQESRLVLIPD